MIQAIYFALHFALIFLGVIITIYTDMFWLGLTLTIFITVKWFLMKDQVK